ncbi:YheC/YheD family protein [Gracilibacillus caseinilyticus]|uniref:YheC/YheD family protein n=1 Tax=Gracilibacillus caseinilyticus TaxID=2932256 RepID=A0ABY4ES43_9BACI|nr:YheC/YheD family protein [Gracilibacillus caseinilyticus]UOQ46790.1 YheC/YheD family protein [Gracilibacillus caseinilyticus]
MRSLFEMKSYPNNKNRLIVPKQYYASIKDCTTLQHGMQKIPCDILSHQRNDNTIYLSSAIMEHFHIKRNSKMMIDTDEAELFLYYQLGVLVHRAPQQLNNERLFQEMARIGHTLGFETILFSYQQVASTSNSLTGFVWKNQWKAMHTEIPPVIYNRIPNRKLEAHVMVKHVKQYLTTTSIIFNPDFFHKWQVYETLISDDRVNYLLPDTTFHPSIETLEQKLEQHPVYVQAYQENASQPVYLEKITETEFFVSRKNEQTTFSDLTKLCKQYFRDGLPRYVVQDAVDLQHHQQNPAYLRAYVQRDRTWQLTLLYGKDTLTNTLIPVHHLINKNMTQKIKKMAITIAKVLEHKFNGEIGELGFDIGLDNEQRLWLLEVHAKPTWYVFDHPAFATKAQSYFTALFGYALSATPRSE